jgi:hypothetical protein
MAATISGIRGDTPLQSTPPTAGSIVNLLVSSDVDAARVQLQNTSVEIQDRLKELEARITALQSDIAPGEENDAMAFAFSEAIMSSADLNVRGALQYQLAEITRKNFVSLEEKPSYDASTTEEALAQLEIAESRLGELRGAVHAERDVVVADILDLRDYVLHLNDADGGAGTAAGDGMPAVWGFDPGRDARGGSALQKMPGGRSSESQAYVSKVHAQLSQLLAAFQTKSSGIFRKNTELARASSVLREQNKGLKKQIEALKYGMSKLEAATNHTGAAGQGGGNSSGRGGGDKSGQGGMQFGDETTHPLGASMPFTRTASAAPAAAAAAAAAAASTHPLLELAMDNLLRVMIMSRIPLPKANALYEMLLDFGGASGWSETQFVACCRSANALTSAMRAVGKYDAPSRVKSALQRDPFFASFRGREEALAAAGAENGPALAAASASSGLDNGTPPNAVDRKGEGRRFRMVQDSDAAVPSQLPSLEGEEDEQFPPSSAPPPPKSAPPASALMSPVPPKTVPAAASRGVEKKEKGVKAEEEERMVVRKTPSLPRSHAEVEVDSLVYLKLPSWKNAHRGLVKQLHADGSVDVELRNGTLAEGIAPEYLDFKKIKNI